MISRIAKGLACATALFVATTSATQPAAATDGARQPDDFRSRAFDHGRAAENFLARHGRDGTPAGQLTLEELIETEFLTAPLGLFELAIPRRSLHSSREAARFRGVCLNLIDAQGLWIDWIDEAADPGEELRNDLATVREWIDEWDPTRLAACAKKGEHDCYEALEASDEQREASERLNRGLRGGALTGTTNEVQAVRIGLFPTRSDFVEMLCVVGYLRPTLQSAFWVDGIETWHEFEVTDANLYGLAMAYPGARVSASNYSNGTPMEAENGLALGEQITQLAVNAMLRKLYDDELPPTVVNGLSINLVIEVFGEIDTRADGNLEGRKTNSRETFVPGGRSEGGLLPTNMADNRWRVDRGRYHFTRALRRAQKEGSKEKGRSKIKRANFTLRTDESSAKHLVMAPFLGAGVEPATTPTSLETDYSELLRAYRCAFLYWMRTAGGGSKKASATSWAQWLVQLGDLEADAAFEDSLLEAYGDPLSGPKLDKHTLEGRFLTWLSKRKTR